MIGPSNDGRDLRTEIERSFENLTPGNRLSTARELRYDPPNLWFEAPIVVASRPVSNSERRLYEPTLEEVREGLVRMVRTETSRPIGPPPPRPGSGPEYAVDEGLIYEYRDWAERDLIGPRPLEAIVADRQLTDAERIHRILSSRSIGNPRNRANLSPSSIDRVLARLYDSRAPLQLVVPAFPFKDQGAFNTEGSADSPDMGEVAMLIRMHCLATVLSHVHLEYVQWIVLSDGPLYASIFGLDIDTTLTYMDRLRVFRDRLNLRSTVHIVSLGDVIRFCNFRYGSKSQFLDAFSHYVLDIRAFLEDLIRSDPQVLEAMHQLTMSLVWNIDTRRYLRGNSTGHLWKAMTGAKPTGLLSREIYGQSREAALRYASLNLALGLSNAIALQFPNGVRATSHAKAGQVALPQIGNVAPWNGVGAIRRDAHVGSLRTVRVHDVWRDRAKTPVGFLDGSASPFVYGRS